MVTQSATYQQLQLVLTEAGCPSCRLSHEMVLPHLEHALQAAQHSVTRDLLIDIHRLIWEQLSLHLSEFIRKQDYRFHRETITDDERLAVERSIAVLMGESLKEDLGLA